MWLSWLEHRPIDQKLVGSIPRQGTHPGCGFRPVLACPGGSQSMFLSLPPPSLPPSDKLLVVPHRWVGLAGNPASRLPG